MSNKSGTSNQVISLPQGGGALHGIGEKFSPDLYTGTGNFTVPIALPPGRNGFQPQLNLVYSTGTGNSPFGLGWGLSIPGVTAGRPLREFPTMTMPRIPSSFRELKTSSQLTKLLELFVIALGRKDSSRALSTTMMPAIVTGRSGVRMDSSVYTVPLEQQAPIRLR